MRTKIPFERISFSGHESFALRFAWLKKGYDAICSDEAFFGSKDAMVVLGTGKNMVSSIRHWGIACGVWSETPGSRGASFVPTQLGHLIFSNDGWDPYLEDVGSIWWLHWNLVRNLDRATSWSWLFSRPRSRFKKAELVRELTEFGENHGLKKVSQASLKRDIEVLVRSYCRLSPRKGKSAEDVIDCPLAILDLIRPSAETSVLELIQSDQPSLPMAVFDAALADYCSSVLDGATGSVSLDELSYAPHSPGRVLRLTPEAMTSRIVSASSSLKGLEFDETAGLRQVFVQSNLLNPLDILRTYFEEQLSGSTA